MEKFCKLLCSDGEVVNFNVANALFFGLIHRITLETSNDLEVEVVIPVPYDSPLVKFVLGVDDDFDYVHDNNQGLWLQKIQFLDVEYLRRVLLLLQYLEGTTFIQPTQAYIDLLESEEDSDEEDDVAGE